MKWIFGMFLIVSVSVAHTTVNKDGKREGKDYFVLVPHPQPVVHLVPVVAPVVPASPPMKIGPMMTVPQLTCGSPAFMCQGACTSRQVGGIPAVKAEMPWNAQIYTSQRHICSGSLIDQNYVLTSASCVEPTTPASVAALRIRLGDFNRANDQDGMYVERNVTTVYRHSDFVPLKPGQAPLNNIALLKLGQPVLFNERIRPICLDEASTRVDTGVVEGIVAGYGVLSYSTRQQTDDLYKVNARIGSPQECQNAYSQHGYRLTDREICAGVDSNGAGLTDPCVGDDGGPLIVQNGPNSYRQVGIASFGVKCSGPPQVFTRISSYRQWIDQVRFYYPTK